jgi:signal transduction histidine kinase
MSKDSALYQQMDEQQVSLPLLQTVINFASVGVQILKPVYREADIVDFRYVFINEKGKQYLPKADMTGKTFFSFNVNPGASFHKMVIAIKTQREIESEDTFITAAGKCIANVRYVPLLDTICLFFEDSAEVEQLKKVISKKDESIKELNSELRSFNSVIATDYKETLQSLYTSLEFLISKEVALLSDASKANIRRSQAALQRMKLLTEDINGFLRLYEIGVHPTLIDPNVVLDNVVSKMQRKFEQANAEIEVKKLPALNADPLLLSWLFTNLLDNCIKFRKMVAAPVIKIRSSRADEMNVISTATKNVQYLIISILDNGIGFKDTEAERIFELFYRINDKSYYRGSGIGLTICKKIMEMHGGFITAEGSPAHGATFNCYFPVS